MSYIVYLSGHSKGATFGRIQKCWTPPKEISEREEGSRNQWEIFYLDADILIFCIVAKILGDEAKYPTFNSIIEGMGWCLYR